MLLRSTVEPIADIGKAPWPGWPLPRRFLEAILALAKSFRQRPSRERTLRALAALDNREIGKLSEFGRALRRQARREGFGADPRRRG